MVKSVLLVLLACCAVTAQADVGRSELFLEIGSAELVVEQYGSGGDRLLWIPSEFGARPGVERQLAAGIAGQGLSVWLTDLHTAYFVPPGRSSYRDIPVEDLAELIESSRPAEGRLFLLAAGRGAALLLRAARRWRLDHPEAAPLGGMILLHPNLAQGVAGAGQQVEYLPIARATNLPIYIFQPLNSAKRWHLKGLVGQLESGGSSVFVHPLKGVSDGYQVRGDATVYELQARQRLPALVAQAARRLNGFNKMPRTVVALDSSPGKGAVSGLAAGLQPLPGAPVAPELRLADIDGRSHDLADYRGKVVLLNFWTTWCPPCVEELPSLGRLQQQFDSEAFVVLGVDVGEEPAAVKKFLKKVPAAFPVLLDRDGQMVKPWRIRAFPTSFLIDKQGRMRYGYFGALKWDAEEVVSLVEAELAR